MRMSLLPEQAESGTSLYLASNGRTNFPEKKRSRSTGEEERLTLIGIPQYLSQQPLLSNIVISIILLDGRSVASSLPRFRSPHRGVIKTSSNK
ncbi:hypothetical protein RIF29_03392 [Crotalaria pallida]|uniref:Uncharacterized protein n=1 Tax=Crotalaria pallida TaxID=3830 RepID=A0AAN9IZW6_CROPI